ncbi:MAG: pyridoxamine 5'-phosphate oxidase family protein [Jatrophihabitantaceae bacterium]
MSVNYGRVAFTEGVQRLQERYGNRAGYARQRARAHAQQDPMTDEVRDFLSQRDSFYLASVGETGWPYVQYRGGPVGFLRVLDEHTVAWADFRGNLQYISTGNVSSDDRVALFAMDYPRRRRLKLFGHARVSYAQDEPDLIARLIPPGYPAVVERAVIVSVDAFDWNCQQHITPRYTVAELEPHLAAFRERIAALEAENTALQAENTALSQTCASAAEA